MPSAKPFSTIPFDFSGKNVVVIGGTSGINRGISEAFAKSGANVAVASRNQSKVDSTLESLRQYAGSMCGFAADVRNAEDLEAGISSVVQTLGSIDVLVSGAAGQLSCDEGDPQAL